MVWASIEDAPRDGTEILVKDADGHQSLVAWSNSPAEDGWCHSERDAGWYRRAEGGWDLFDAFAPQEVDPVRWLKIPEDTSQ